MNKLPFVLAITGASGSIYGLRMLQYLLEIEQPVELLISAGAKQVMQDELAETLPIDFNGDIKPQLLSYLNIAKDSPLTMHKIENYGASVASGSYKTMGMAIVPCSLGTLGAVASGLTNSLIYRAAAVTLKERRPLLLLVREMPFGHIQIKQMSALSDAGAIIASASPGFYHKPKTISDLIDFVVGRVLDQFGFDHSLFKRWTGQAKQLITHESKR